MKFYIVSIFPEIFDSFFQTSLIKKAQEKNLLQFETYNPRNFCKNKHNQIDDEIYGGGHGMLIMAQPMIDCLNSIIEKIDKNENFLILNLTPSKTVFNQELAINYAKNYKNIIVICGRYEGIDHRFSQYFQKRYPDRFVNLSLGRFVVMGGESPAMVIIEAISRIVPNVIKESESRKQESYQVENNLENIEYPQYTRPQIVEGMEVPEVLLSGHDAKIKERKQKNTGSALF